MQRKEFEKNWDQWKTSIRSHWNKLTDDDMYLIDGMWDQFIGKLAHRYGYSREMAEKEISNWMPRGEESDWEGMGRSEESPESEEERGKRKAHGKMKGSEGREWQKPREERGGMKGSQEEWQKPREEKGGMKGSQEEWQKPREERGGMKGSDSRDWQKQREEKGWQKPQEREGRKPNEGKDWEEPPEGKKRRKAG